MNRKRLLLPAALVGAAFCWGARPASSQTPVPFVKSPDLPKFAQPLRGVGPGGIPVAVPDGTRKHLGIVADHYTIDINQYTDKLHPDLPPTTLWGYNPETALGVTGIPTQKHLGGIIVAQRGTPTQITFKNKLPNKHILPVDNSLMGAEANQAANRTSVHLHGGFVPWTSDGGPTAWWDPQGNKGSTFFNNTVLRPGQNVPKNEAEYYYPNSQSARMEWYHDHAMGTTRLNAYAGIASAYIIRDKFESDVLVNMLGLPQFVEKGGRELPLVFQDKIFEPTENGAFPGSAKTAGSLWYPYTYDPARWELCNTGTPPPDVSVIPEMFGDTMLVNGAVCPKATVDPRHYRLRILNACQARFLNLQLYEDNGLGQPDFTKPGPAWIVIGTEGGFLVRPVRVPSGVQMKWIGDPCEQTVDPADPGGSLITSPAERWDVVVDFNGKGGKKYILWNDAPAPFPGGDPINVFPAGICGGTQELMEFEVKADSKAIAKDSPYLLVPGLPVAGLPISGIDPPLAGAYPKEPAALLNWDLIPNGPLPIPTRPGIRVRQLTLNETFDECGRLIQMLGTNEPTGTLVDGLTTDFSRAYMDPATEITKAGATEVWQIANLTMDTHPVHFHLANAQLLSRQPFDAEAYQATRKNKLAHAVYTGPARGPLPIELGWKETIKMNPGEVTTVIMKFELPSVPFVVPVDPMTGGYDYVWHCHILDHEEHDMMRPLIVMP